MSKYIIEGGKKLSGTIAISGAKNSALKILAATLLTDSPSVIKNVPRIADIEKMENIIRDLGAQVSVDGSEVTIDPRGINKFELNKDLTKRLRGSIVLAGPMLAKFSKIKFFQPGGCLIGVRNIDDHLDIFEQLGVSIVKTKDGFEMSGKPKASKIILSKMSVTATENAIMASVLSDGETIVQVAAAEPEITDLCNFLNKAGAKISGIGSHEIRIVGVKNLKGMDYSIIPDRIEAGTYLIAAILTNSEVEIGPIISNHMSIVIKKLRDIGAKFDIIIRNNQEFIKTKKSKKLIARNVDTRTYPGFPTDLQSVYTTLMTQASGTSTIFETLFESRFGYINELQKMGAKISVESPHIIKVHGSSKLKARKIQSLDIRAGGALVIASLIAEGTSEIDNIELIERGYESMDQKLNSVGAKIVKVD